MNLDVIKKSMGNSEMTLIKMRPVFLTQNSFFWLIHFFKSEKNDLRMIIYFSFIFAKIQNFNKDYSTSETKIKNGQIGQKQKSREPPPFYV